MTAEGAGGGELAQLVSDHILRNEYGHMVLAVVYGYGMTDELGEYGGGTAPRVKFVILDVFFDVI